MSDLKRIEPGYLYPVEGIVPPRFRSAGGKWVAIGDEEFKVPAFGLLAVQELQEEVPNLALIRGVPNKAQMALVFKFIHSALQRNYPDLSIDEVSRMIDLGNFKRVLEAVLEVSGFVKKTEEPASGEAKASTGERSTSL